jgi:hypothetical protein
MTRDSEHLPSGKEVLRSFDVEGRPAIEMQTTWSSLSETRCRFASSAADAATCWWLLELGV